MNEYLPVIVLESLLMIWDITVIALVSILKI
jgi:hypothetical protein